ncbi:MAG: M48 family metallopeptidase [Bacteroidales bacterium]|jgi:predicted metal-dependent hydrolase|nr:M48 family metallopeptidase [Bacteroidales bacterium]
MQKIIVIPEIGNVVIKKNPNNKKIRLSINEKRGVVVTIPLFCKYEEAEKFVYKNIEWLKMQQVAINVKKNNTAIFTPATIIYTRKFEIKFVASITVKFFTLNFGFSSVKINYNMFAVNFEKENVQKIIAKIISDIFQKEAREYVIPRIKKISEVLNLPYNKCTIGTAKTRWGTCDSKNNIILSSSLMMLPDNLIDFIIIHELCHTKHKNHSQDFHKLVNLCTDGKETKFQNAIKTYSTKIKPGDYRYNIDSNCL